jgi:hypothetical protein
MLQLTDFGGSFRAENGIRTRDPQLGKLMLYQLSYFREVSVSLGVCECAKIYFLSDSQNSLA